MLTKEGTGLPGAAGPARGGSQQLSLLRSGQSMESTAADGQSGDQGTLLLDRL